MSTAASVTDTATSHPTGQHWVAPAERMLFGSPPRPPEPLVVDLRDEVTQTQPEAGADLLGAQAAVDPDSTADRPLGQLVATSPQSQVRLEGYALLRDLSQDTPDPNAAPPPPVRRRATPAAAKDAAQESSGTGRGRRSTPGKRPIRGLLGHS